MSQPDLSSANPPAGVLGQKQSISIFTIMLIVALVAMLFGCLFLFLEIGEYGGFGAVSGRVSSLWAPSNATAVAQHLGTAVSSHAA